MRSILLFSALAILAFSCSTDKNIADYEVVELDTILVEDYQYKRPYQAARTHVVDLIHTKLDLKFDWEKQYVYGKANLTFEPWFYPVSMFEIDAKGFDVNSVELVGKEGSTDLTYDYDNERISLTLPKAYEKGETFEIFIEYTGKPNEKELGGSAAITQDKGLYFINPLGEDPNKPKQIWTQGETEANSVWFPTIDSPNEKMTQEFHITIASNYKTLSNGTLVFSTENGDGTRTDIWEQKTPHAPYLAMMAIGEFAVVEDSWRDSMLVDYWVEPEFESHAQAIFGNTPEMIEFYSEVLEFPYPWDKYSQVVVRDYVSGAMENTSAVIFGEFAQKTTTELIDGSSEDVVAHELFHHWFGDIVTCESWSNLPLNESFATYGEYLWNEHKYGRDYADHHGQNDLRSYLSEFNNGKAVDMIRFDYMNKEDMFDSHSYAKGGRILHMLRKHVGDDAFFASLNKYLTDNAFQSVEIHNLRLAFEEVTGEDLNWFFNQWFLNSGHPELEINYSYDTTNQEQVVHIKQTQDLENYPLYHLPLQLDLYTNGEVESHSIVIDSVENTFRIGVASVPDLVNVDAEKMLLCTKVDNKSTAAYVYQFYHAPLYLDRREALQHCSSKIRRDPASAQLVYDALFDDSKYIRESAVKLTDKLRGDLEDKAMAQLQKMAQEDPSSQVRAAAINALKGIDDAKVLEAICIQQMEKDSSYFVIGTALRLMMALDEKTALTYAAELEKEESTSITLTLLDLYAEYNINNKADYFRNAGANLSGFDKFSYIGSYVTYVLGGQNQELDPLLTVLSKEVQDESSYWIIRYYTAGYINMLEESYQSALTELEVELAKSEDGGDLTELNKAIIENQNAIQKVNEVKVSLRDKVSDKRVKAVLE